MSCAALGCEEFNTSKNIKIIYKLREDLINCSFGLKEDHSGLLCRRHYDIQRRDLRRPSEPSEPEEIEPLETSCEIESEGKETQVSNISTPTNSGRKKLFPLETQVLFQIPFFIRPKEVKKK